MEKIGTYKIIAERRLIVEFFSGEIYIDDIIHMQSAVSKEPGYDPTFNLVFDTREANVLVNKEGMMKYLDFVKSQPRLYGKRKAGYLTSKPNEVVVGTIFSNLVKDVPIHANVFSTVDALVLWLNNKLVDSQSMLEVLSELKTQPNVYTK